MTKEQNQIMQDRDPSNLLTKRRVPVFRKMVSTDIPVLLSWMTSEEEVVQWGGPHFSYPIDSLIIEKLVKQHQGEKPSRECWVMCSENQQVIGHFQLGFNVRTQEAILGRVIIAPSYRGTGLAYHLLTFAKMRAFSRDSVHRLELRVYDFNRSAICAYRRAGFVKEGIRRESVPVNTEFWNTMIMRMLRAEYFGDPEILKEGSGDDHDKNYI